MLICCLTTRGSSVWSEATMPENQSPFIPAIACPFLI